MQRKRAQATIAPTQLDEGSHGPPGGRSAHHYPIEFIGPTSIVHLCVVIPNPQMKRIQAVLARPAFRNLKMHERCVIIPEEMLLEHAEHILRWASSPSVITRLALQVRDL